MNVCFRVRCRVKWAPLHSPLSLRKRTLFIFLETPYTTVLILSFSLMPHKVTTHLHFVTILLFLIVLQTIYIWVSVYSRSVWQSILLFMAIFILLLTVIWVYCICIQKSLLNFFFSNLKFNLQIILGYLYK